MQLVLYSLFLLIYFIFKVRKGYSTRFILKRLGLSLHLNNYYLYALLLAIFSIFITWGLFKLFPIDSSLLAQTSYKNYTITKISLYVILIVFIKELLMTTLGEELVFRGLIGGYLFEKFGFLKANLFQSMIFLIPHFLLLLISVKLFPILIVIAISAWILGWLRFKSKSILPGILTHTLVNTISIIYFFANV